MLSQSICRSIRSHNRLLFSARRYNSTNILKRLGISPLQTKGSGETMKKGNSNPFLKKLDPSAAGGPKKFPANNQRQQNPKSSSNPNNNKNQRGNFNNSNRNNSRGNKPGVDQQQQHFRKPKAARVLDPIERLQENLFDPATFKWTHGETELENEYMTFKIKEIYEINPSFKIVTPAESGIVQLPLRRFIQDLLPDESFDILDVQEIKGSRLAFLKTLDKKVCLKNYNEKLAEEKSKLFGRTREKKRDAGVKFIKVSWEISEHDLQNQKTNEILGLVKSGQKIVLLIDTREKIGNKNLVFEIAPVAPEEAEMQKKPKLGELEEIRRHKILDYIKGLFGDEIIEVTGSLDNRILITVKPAAVQKRDPVVEKIGKDAKKLERQLKQKQREEEKRAKLEEKKREHEELVAKLNAAS